MTFSVLPMAAVLGGLLGLAGILFLLQRLRVRHKEQLVVTTMFWREAVEETRARVLTHRFRHPWAYLLVLLLASLLWLALAGPVGGRDGAAESYVLVDGSLLADRDPAQVAAGLEPLLDQLPRRRTTVWCAAGVPEVLLLPGEHPSLLVRRLQQVGARHAPGRMAQVLHRVAEGSTEERPRDVYLVGGSLPLGFQDLLPGTVTLWNWPLSDTGSQAPNRGLTALGVGAAASRRPDRVDALVLARTSDDSSTGTVQVRLDGRDVPADQVQTTATEAGTRLLVRDLPAEGGLLEAVLPGGDPVSGDDQASLFLPTRPILGVDLQGDVPAEFQSVVAVDLGLRSGGADPQVALRSGAGAANATLPVLELVPWSELGHAFEVVAPDAQGEDLQQVLESLGLDQIDATGLAEETGRIIDVGLVPGPRRGLRVARELCQDTFNFTRARAFPLFVARSLRWLAGQPELLQEVVTGRALAGVPGPFLDEQGRTLDPLGDDFVPADRGRFTSGDGRVLAASWLDPVHTLGGYAEAEPLATAEADTSFWPRLATLFMALALLGSLIEWFLYRTARIP